MTRAELDARERGTILAALRCWQRERDSYDNIALHVHLAENEENYDFALTNEEIDDLFDKLDERS